MPQIIKGQSFADGDLVTGLTLNNIIDLATLGVQSITAQTAVSSFDVQSSDYFLIYDSSASGLRKSSVDDLFRSGQTVKFSSISGIAGSDLAVSIAGGFSFVINGNTSIPANLTVTGLVQGGTGKFTTEITIPTGTTATRPASPVAGSFRYNTTTTLLEVYNGTAWVDTSVLGTNNTFSGTNTFSNTVNITGNIQFNGTPVYALSAITEEDIPNATGSGVLFTSSSFTKPSDEIWVFEVNSVIATIGGSAWSGNLSFLNTSGTPYFIIYDANVGNFDYSGTALAGGDFDCRWVVQAGVTLTIETVRISLNLSGGAGVTLNPTFLANPNSKFRIYKYRTA
jgi:hypothetical protein